MSVRIDSPTETSEAYANHPTFDAIDFPLNYASAAILHNLSLFDLVDANDLQQIQDGFADIAGVASVITDIDGYPLTRPSNFSKVCNIVRATEKGYANCRASTKSLGEKSYRFLQPTYHNCHSCGFIEASAPIIVAGRHIANWLIGQINPYDVSIRRLHEYAIEIGANSHEVTAAFDPTRSMSTERFEKTLALLWSLSKKISKLGYNNLVLSKDNTTLLSAKKEIKQLNQDLKNRIAEIERANNDLHEALATLQETQINLIQKEKMAALGSLVAGIAHEINTPIGVGVTAVSFLEQETLTLNELFQQGSMKKSDLKTYLNVAIEAMHIVSLNLQHASELILNFKKVAVDQSNEEYRQFNVRQYIGAVLLSLRPTLKKFNHNVTVNCDEQLIISSYPGVFSQIITNLLMNSLNHAYDENQTGNILIDIHIAKNTLSLQYSDDGKGIPAEYIGKIFDPFFTTRRGQGGTGLGLNILYNIVTQTLKGTVSCSSEPHQGTTFTITFPIEMEALYNVPICRD